MRRILIKNGKVWDGEKFLSADVYVEDGIVKSVSYSINAEAEFVYDANGAIVSAGLIDSHVHIRGLSNSSTGLPESVFSPFGVTAAVEAWAEKFDESVVSADNAVQIITDSATIYLPLSDLVDTEKERARLQGEEKRLTGEIDRLTKKLSNEGFVAKAPAAVVDAERQKLARYHENLEGVRAALAKLG